jgi:hypothetical protein
MESGLSGNTAAQRVAVASRTAGTTSCAQRFNVCAAQTLTLAPGKAHTLGVSLPVSRDTTPIV